MADQIKVNRKAPTTNVAAFSTLIQRVVERPFGVTGMACFFGEPGLGKTEAAVQGANIYRAAYVECGQFTTARSLLIDILTELGDPRSKGTITDLIKLAIYRMASNPMRPVIVDEAHHIANKRFVDVLRELHDKSRAPVILIGEETLPKRLQAFPQVKDRMLVEVEAVPCDRRDFDQLARVYAPRVKLADDLIDTIIRRTGGNARRIVVNLARAAEVILPSGADTLDLQGFGGPSMVTGNTLLSYQERK